MKRDNVKEIIKSHFGNKEMLKGLGEEDDFFDLGVSSLTIVELQITIEKEIGVTVPTKMLMASSTIKEWVDIYTKAFSEVPESEDA